jgi:large subunit ribosomal protein L3
MSPKIRTWPKIAVEKPTLLGFPGYKAGTIHLITIDDREKTPNFGKPLFNMASVLAVPEVEVKALRLYAREQGADRPIGEVKLGGKVPELKGVSRVVALVSAVPKDTGLSQKVPFEFEVGVSGGDLKAQVEYVFSMIGKKAKFAEVFRPGMYVDVLGITKGQGFEGEITRFGVKRKQHKSRKTVRTVGVIGPWHPAAVMYTVPRAGQMGFHQRTESGKRILLMGNGKENPITPKGGFLHFGDVTGDYVVVRGSVPGPARRFAFVRYSARPKGGKSTPPQVIEVSTRVAGAK